MPGARRLVTKIGTFPDKRRRAVHNGSLPVLRRPADTGTGPTRRPMTDQAPEFYFPAPRRQHFCSQCGTPVVQAIPPGDNRLRDLCQACGAVHYQNPRIVVGSIPVWRERILLCLRAIEPRRATWTLPAGFMELAETTREGAWRETREEAGAQVRVGELYTVIDIPRADQVHFFFLAKASGPELDPGPESLEARYFAPEEIPWEQLSFRSVVETLRYYLADSATGCYPARHLCLEPRRHGPV